METRDPLAPRQMTDGDTQQRDPALDPKPQAPVPVDPITEALTAFKSAQQGFNRAMGEAVASEQAVQVAAAEMATAEEAHKGTIAHREMAADQLRNAVDDVIGALQVYRGTIS